LIGKADGESEKVRQRGIEPIETEHEARLKQTFR
jgi:hypothetical protein